MVVNRNRSFLPGEVNREGYSSLIKDSHVECTASLLFSSFKDNLRPLQKLSKKQFLEIEK